MSLWDGVTVQTGDIAVASLPLGTQQCSLHLSLCLAISFLSSLLLFLYQGASEVLLEHH